jgi:cysteine desulfurase
MHIYLDNASTTPIDPIVSELMFKTMTEDFGNPSSIHWYGRKAKTLIEDSRRTIANLLGVSQGEIFFTSCATESHNMILWGAVEDLGIKRVISSPTEHPCILNCLKHLESLNKLKVDYLQVDAKGNPNLTQLKELLEVSNANTMVSLMHANNEIGTMIDLNQVATICAEHNVLLHSDTVQSIGKFKLHLENRNIHFIAGSAHKFYGPKGAGFVYIHEDFPFRPFLNGGGQERNMRSGTENIYGIVGLAKALELSYNEMDKRKDHILQLRQYLKTELTKTFDDVQYLGNQDKDFLYTILNVSFPKSPRSDMMNLNLDIAGICVSSGSACSSGAEKQSSVLNAISADPSRKPIRVSFSHKNTVKELDQFVDELRKILPAKKLSMVST